MSITKLISWMTVRNAGKIGERMNYDAISKGAAGCTISAEHNFLPCLRPVENEVETYFKDVFAGSVF